MPPTNSDPYLALHSDSDEDLSPSFMDVEEIPGTLPALDKFKLLYYINRLNNVHCLCIPPSIAPDILFIAHGKSCSGFSCCYKIITRSWYIRDLTKLFYVFIKYCPQCTTFLTSQYTHFGSFHPIQSSSVLFFTLTLDFVLTLLLLKEKYNTIILVTYKFSKWVTLIKGADTWFANQWAHAFLNRLDLIDWTLPGELIIAFPMW